MTFFRPCTRVKVRVTLDQLMHQYYILTFTYYGSLEIEKLIKIVLWAQIGISQALEAGKCDFDSFCLAYTRGKVFARSSRHLGAIIFAPFGQACVKAA